VDRPTRRRRAGELLEVVGMSRWGDTRIATYSKGMLQRVGLAQALVNDPELVLLDEPTDGVDPVGRRDILDVLGRMRQQGKTVFINSHALSELETICDRVAILVRGQVARQGSLDELTIAKQRYEIEVGADDPLNLRSRILVSVPAGWKSAGDGAAPVQSPAAPAVPAAPPPIPSLNYAAPPQPPVTAPELMDRGTLAGGLQIELEGAVLRIPTIDPAHVQPVIDSLRGSGLLIRRVQSVRPSLEDLFLDTVAGPGVGSAAERAL